MYLWFAIRGTLMPSWMIVIVFRFEIIVASDGHGIVEILLSGIAPEVRVTFRFIICNREVIFVFFSCVGGFRFDVKLVATVRVPGAAHWRMIRARILQSLDALECIDCVALLRRCASG